MSDRDESRPAGAEAGAYPLLQKLAGPADLKKLSVDELPDLAAEMRQAICDQVSRSGGHLAPNLGVVELTIALHYVFDFAYDRLLFDVGHQCYPHKLLTGRLAKLPQLRKRGGMAGFPEPRESDFDLFSVGHAGTAISTAVGMARGDAVMGAADRRCVSIVGDASIANGLAMEGLNNAGTLKRQFLVVLNDNGMSIAAPQGALAQYFDRVRVSDLYDQLKAGARRVLSRIPGGETLEEMYHRASEAMKAAIYDGHMFEHFGLLCLGPIDGHDIPTLIDMLNELHDYPLPVLLHVKTKKGKGFEFSEDDATTFHSPKPFKVNGCRVEIPSSGRSFTAAFADSMLELMTRDEKVFAVTAAMPDGTGIKKVMEQYPDRTLDTGICESHAMDMCAGMAKAGVKPFFAVYSTFSQRALDQVFQEIALQGLPVRVCMDRAGYVGGDGAVHHGFMDISMFRVFPGVTLMAASDEPNLRAAMEFMRQYEAGGSFLRYPRDNVAARPLQEKVAPYELGKAALVKPSRKQRDGKQPDLALFAYGVMVYEAARALDELETQGYDVALYDARFAKPVDVDLLRQLLEAGVQVVTVEDHALTGGFGAAVLEACHEQGLPVGQLHRMGMPEQWVYQDSRANQLAEVGLNAAAIARRVRQILRDEADEEVKGVPAVHVNLKSQARVVR